MEIEPIRRIEKFTEVYHKFNPSFHDRNLYAVNSEIAPKDDCLIGLLDSVEKSLGLISTAVLPSIAFFLNKDIAYYRTALNKIIDSQSSDCNRLDIQDFKRVIHRNYITREVIQIGIREYKFSQVNLVNPIGGEMVVLESKHSVLLDSSEHVYAILKNEVAYIIALQSSISKIYKSVFDRVDLFKRDGAVSNSFPEISIKNETILALTDFHRAVDVVAAHRDIDRSQAESVLKNWFKFLPGKFHRPLIALIAAHHVMAESDISVFIDKVKNLLSNKNLNPFLIKDLEDFNGTHRVLYKCGNIGRNVADFSPINIEDGATVATIIVDNIISGSQIIAALKYYASDDKKCKESDKYFKLTDKDRDLLKARLKGLQRLDLCTILYTKNGVNRIKDECRALLNQSISINIVNGRDIGDDAYFGSTQKLGESIKDEIRAMLTDRTQMDELNTYLSIGGRGKYGGISSIDDIDNVNLVARYQSLPKKCFKFLHCGLKLDSSCHPMVRIFEANE